MPLKSANDGLPAGAYRLHPLSHMEMRSVGKSRTANGRPASELGTRDRTKRAAIEYAPLTSDRLDDVKRLLLPFWKRSWDPSLAERIFRWRFLDRVQGEATLAYDGARPVGFIDAFLRAYVSSGGDLRVRECADWFAHPDYRPLVGIQLLRGMMAKPEPLLTVGGTDGTRRIMARMGWRDLPSLVTYALPTGTGAAVKGLSKRLGFSLSSVPRVVARGLSIRTTRSLGAEGPLPQGSVVRVEDVAAFPRVAPDPGSYGLSAVVTVEDFRWLRMAPPEMGRFIFLAFETSEGERGLSVSRVFEDGSFRAARILHLTASAPSPGMYAWMIQETARRLLETGTQWIAARFNCPQAQEGLESVGFRPTGRCPAFWWHRNHPDPEAPMHLGWSTGDEGVLPYPD